MTEVVSQFHFLRPEWLLLLLPLIALALLAMRRHGRAVQWQALIAPHLLPFLVDGKSVRHSRLPVYGLMALWLLATLAAAGPAWRKLPQPVMKEASALVIAWDLSPSMAAEDIKPSRLVRGRLKLIDLLKERKEGLTALIAYSGEAHVVTPLTDDTETIISLLYGLDPAIMPAKGSNAEMALELANQLLAEGANGSGNILFLTDGISADAQQNLLQLHDNAPHKITFWGIGTSEGAPIPLAGGGFAYDGNRNMVIAKLNDRELSELADKTGGLYVPFSQTDFDLETIQHFAFHADHSTNQATERQFDQWYEHGPYLLVLLLPFAALAFRRGLLLAFPLLFIVSPPADALEWQDLWQTRDQQGQNVLNTSPEEAASLFQNPEWQGVANYQAGNYEQALNHFSGDTAASQYNRGNALTHLGQYDQAIESYRKALAQDPDNSAARNNLAIAEQLKALQENEQQQEQQGDDQNNQDSKQQQNAQDSQSQNSENSDKSSDQDQAQQQSEGSSNNSDQAQQQASSSSDGQDSRNDSNHQNQMSQQEQDALEDTYGQQVENSDQQNGEKRDRKAEEEPDEQQHMLANDDNKDGEPQDENKPQDEDMPANPIVQREVREKTEEQQALEQWLRKVPDDPSGLMRNKFNYEYRARKRELQSNGWRQPDGKKSEERW